MCLRYSTQAWLRSRTCAATWRRTAVLARRLALDLRRSRITSSRSHQVRSAYWSPDMATLDSNASARRPAGQSGSLLDRITLAGSLLAALFLCFVGGAWVVLAQVFPYPYLAQAYEGGQALLAKETEYLDPYKTDFWKPAWTSAKGVTRHDAARAQQGLTLYTSGQEARAYLVGDGRRGGARMAAAVQRGLGRKFARAGPAAGRVHLLEQGARLSERRSAGGLRRGRQFALGLRDGPDRQGFQADLEVSGPGAPRPRRRATTAGSTP